MLGRQQPNNVSLPHRQPPPHRQAQAPPRRQDIAKSHRSGSIRHIAKRVDGVGGRGGCWGRQWRGFFCISRSSNIIIPIIILIIYALIL